MTSAAYLRFPHLRGDLLTFVAEDDVWLAAADGGRAWRLSADDAIASWTRLSRDGSQVAWAGMRDGAAEVYAADVTGGASRPTHVLGRAAHEGVGLEPGDQVLAVTAAAQPFSFWQRAHAVSADAAAPGSSELPFGVVSEVSVEADAVAVLTGGTGDPAWRKRYRGGTAGLAGCARPGRTVRTARSGG